MRSFCLTISRLSLTAWVGAAALFVVTSIVEQKTDQAVLATTTKELLALLRFPWYYKFGFTLVGTSLVFGLLSFKHPSLGKKRACLFLGFVVLALATMTVDYVYIYRPMEAVLQDTGAARPANFGDYHEASKYINAVDLSFCLVAAVLICWPGRRRDNDDRASTGTT